VVIVSAGTRDPEDSSPESVKNKKRKVGSPEETDQAISDRRRGLVCNLPVRVAWELYGQSRLQIYEDISGVAFGRHNNIILFLIFYSPPTSDPRPSLISALVSVSAHSSMLVSLGLPVARTSRFHVPFPPFKTRTCPILNVLPTLQRHF
jgi:hypothetical protein